MPEGGAAPPDAVTIDPRAGHWVASESSQGLWTVAPRLAYARP